jgi:5'-nucleotidase
MSYDLRDKLVVAISSRALFDLDEANRIFDADGLEAYRQYQVSRENEPLAPGTGFPLVRALLSINKRGQGDLVEVVLVSRNDADTGLRVMNSVESHGLSICRAGFTDGRAPYGYLRSFKCDLFLSAYEPDVAAALAAGFAAGLVYQPPEPVKSDDGEVRIAFDGDAVLFAPEAERVYREHGLAEFHRRERESADVPLEAGPFKGLLSALHDIQKRFAEEECPIRTALVTARSAPAHKRAVMTLRHWGIRIDEAFFLGGLAKDGILQEFRPHIFFDDQRAYCEPASNRTPTARVPDPAPPISPSGST